MGQQQILLIVVVTIIVGIATIAAITLFQKEEVVFMEDEYTQIMLEAAEKAQAWYHKPKELGGGGASFKDINWNQVACPIGTADPGQLTLCQDPESQNYMLISGPFESEAIISAHIFVGDDEYEGEIFITSNEIDWYKKWEKK